MSEQTYTASEVRARTGISRRQLERWEQSGYLVPFAITGSGNGSRRRYSEKNVGDIAAALALIRDGYRVDGAWKRLRNGSGW